MARTGRNGACRRCRDLALSRARWRRNSNLTSAKASPTLMGRITRNGFNSPPAPLDARGRRQGLNLLNGHVWIGRIEIQRMDEMRSGPLTNASHGRPPAWGEAHRQRAGKCVEHRSGRLASSVKRDVKSPSKSPRTAGSFAQNRKPRIVDRPDPSAALNSAGISVAS